MSIITYNVDVGIPKTPPPLASANVGNGGHPSPPRHADVLNGWSLSANVNNFFGLFATNFFTNFNCMPES